MYINKYLSLSLSHSLLPFNNISIGSLLFNYLKIMVHGEEDEGDEGEGEGGEEENEKEEEGFLNSSQGRSFWSSGIEKLNFLSLNIR